MGRCNGSPSLKGCGVPVIVDTEAETVADAAEISEVNDEE